MKKHILLFCVLMLQGCGTSYMNTSGSQFGTILDDLQYDVGIWLTFFAPSYWHVSTTPTSAHLFQETPRGPETMDINQISTSSKPKSYQDPSEMFESQCQDWLAEIVLFGSFLACVNPHVSSGSFEAIIFGNGAAGWIHGKTPGTLFSDSFYYILNTLNIRIDSNTQGTGNANSLGQGK